MNANSPKSKLTSALAWLRRQPRAILFPAALLIAILVITVIASLHGKDGAPSAPQIIATAPTVPKHPPQPAAAQTPARAASAAVSAPASTASLPTPAATAEPPVAPAPVAPPAGVEAGHVEIVISQKDQFGAWAQVSRSIESASQTTFTTPATPGSQPDWRVTYRAWIKLSASASIVTLGVAEGAGRAEAQIDGQPLGGRLMAGRSETASMSLQPGWHVLVVSASREGWKRGPGITTRVEIGDGITTPATVTPWAVPVHADARAAASTAMPASASTATRGDAS